MSTTCGGADRGLAKLLTCKVTVIFRLITLMVVKMSYIRVFFCFFAPKLAYYIHKANG